MIQTLSGKMPIPALVGVNYLDWHETPLLIVSKLDEELCPDCLVRFLEYANEYISGFSSDSLGYVVITKSKRISEIQSCLKDKNIGNVQLIIDVNDSFSKGNSFLSVKGWRNAFLVDERRSILMMGDPLTNNRIRQLYDKTIKQMNDMKKKIVIQTKIGSCYAIVFSRN